MLFFNTALGLFYLSIPNMYMHTHIRTQKDEPLQFLP